MTLKNKHILITGGCGFIGSHLARECTQQGAHVTIIDAMIPDYGGNLFNIHDIKNDINLIIDDCRNETVITTHIKNKDLIFNLAGQVSHIDSMNDPHTDLDINTTASLTLLECARKYNPTTHIIYTSTRQIYGAPKTIPVDETHPINPIDINGINKYSAEQMHRLYNDIHEIPTTSLRLTNVYGPGQLIKHNRQGFTGIFIREAILKNPITLYGDGNQKRDFNYVTDVVSALVLCSLSPTSIGKIYNLGHPKAYSLIGFVTCLQDHCDVTFSTKPFPKEKKKIDIGDYQGNFSKIQNELNWSPKIDLKEGLSQTLSYYQSNLKHYWNPS